MLMPGGGPPITDGKPMNVERELFRNITPAKGRILQDSQFFVMQWIGEEYPELQIRFGVLRVVNQARAIRKGRIRAGIATGLTADMMMMETAEKLDSGELREIPVEERAWSRPRELKWYEEDWFHSINAVGMKREEARANVVEIKRRGLLKYLRLDSIETLTCDRYKDLLLFYTLESPPSIMGGIQYGFTPTFGQASLSQFGRYELAIRVYCNEKTLKDKHYELSIDTWKDFSLREITD